MKKIRVIVTKWLFRSSLYKLESIIILATLGCFSVSGAALPQVKAYVTPAAVAEQETETKSERLDSPETEEESDEEPESEAEDEIAQDAPETEENNADTEDAADAVQAAADTSSPGSDQTTQKNTDTAASGTSSGGTASAPAEKVWVPPVYQTIHHDAVYQTVKVVVCNYCAAEFSSASEFQVHKDANGG